MGMISPFPNKQRRQFNTRYYIVHLLKNREIIFLRFYCEDFEKGWLTIHKVRTVLTESYIKDGWEILDIETLTTTRSEYV